MSRPWNDAVGWEFDALRLLPYAAAKAVARRAGARAWNEFLSTRSGVLIVGSLCLAVAGSVAGVWFLAAAFGLGGLGCLAAELVVHLVFLEGPFVRPAAALRARYWYPFLKPYLADELLDHAQGLDRTVADEWRTALDQLRAEAADDAGKLAKT